MIKKICLLVLVVIIAAGCATTTLEQKYYKSYAVGKEATATIGNAFLVDKNGYVENVKRWVGILYSPDG